jgi:HEAT repeat protein
VLASAYAEPRTPVELRRRLANLAGADLPGLFHLSAQGLLPSTDGEELAMSDDERRITRESLALRPRRELVPFLEDLAGQPMSLPERLEAQILLGSMGSGDHLKLLARLTSPAQDRGGLLPELRQGFAGALGAILARDPAALPQIPGLFSESPPGLSGSIVEALASQHSPAVTRTLAALLGRSPGLDLLLLVRLSDRERLHPGDGEPVFESVERYLRQRDPALLSAAVQACGRLGDDGSVEDLVALLDHADARVRASVFEALTRITGLRYGSDAARWTSWYRAEMQWWDEKADGLLVHVERGRGLEFVRASREVLEHHLFRDRIAQSFARALDHGASEETRLACRALEQLRSPVAVAALIECLDDREPLVRQAAWRALRAITGVELPSDAASWAQLAG